jgi:hypothetical protein
MKLQTQNKGMLRIVIMDSKDQFIVVTMPKVAEAKITNAN